MNGTATSQRGHLAAAYAGLVLLPAVALVDTLAASVQGWPPAARGNYGSLMFAACGAALIAATASFLCALLVGPVRRALRRASWRLLSLSTATLAGVLLAEALLAAFAPGPPFHLRPPGTTYVFDPDPFTLYHVSGEAYSTINAQGVRGPELPPRDQAMRVLCVGGSTTECYYLDDDECWTAQLAGQLQRCSECPVWVGAAAVSEYATAQHLRFLAESPLVAEMDAVVLLVGINDFVRQLRQMDTGTHLGPLWARSRILQVVKAAWNRSEAGFVVDRTGEKLDRLRLGGDIAEPAGGLRLDAELDAYRQRLEEICEVARRRKLRLVLVTQPTLWTDYLTPAAQQRLNLARVVPMRRPWSFLDAVPLADAFERYNEATLEVAQQQRIQACDAALALSGQEALFYDDYHLNEAGCAALGRVLADWFCGQNSSPGHGPATTAIPEQAASP
ncbi:MAG: SGNH/GDSL hydrolase family protein [Pirellulales bacterium]|nr:SGNH/GDSL hydrolase family protein [Pirellulales bacterium]